MAGSWNPNNPPIRPGLYANFVEAASERTVGGPRGTTAIPLKTHSGTAGEKEFHTVENENQANDLFGSSNVQSILFALQGGAREVLVYTLPEIDGTTVTEADAYAEAFDAYEAYVFDTFVFDGGVEDATQDSALTWMKANKDDGKHFSIVFGGDSASDEDPSLGNSRSSRLEDNYAVNLITGVMVSGVSHASEDYAPYVAGLISGKSVNNSITYDNVPVDDVTKRLRGSEIETALQAGSLVFVNAGSRVRVEQGVSTDGGKIRSARTRQALLTDIKRNVTSNYIGRVTNNADGQAALVSAIRAYGERLENNNAIMNWEASLDPQYASTGDQVFILVGYDEVDSMERVFLGINV